LATSFIHKLKITETGCVLSFAAESETI